jgi:hypothetical protein
MSLFYISFLLCVAFFSKKRFAGRNEGNAVVFEECVSVEGGGLLKDETRAPFGSPAAYSKVQGKQAGPMPAPTHHQVCSYFYSYVYLCFFELSISSLKFQYLVFRICVVY